MCKAENSTTVVPNPLFWSLPCVQVQQMFVVKKIQFGYLFIYRLGLAFNICLQGAISKLYILQYLGNANMIKCG